MQKDALNNVHISAEQVLITPEELKNQFPLSADDENEIATARNTIANILQGRDHRLLVVCGPCSIHDPDAALDYARRLKTLAADLSDQLYIVMRVYFEKPRTTVGWKGLINDPYMDDSFRVDEGMAKARELLMLPRTDFDKLYKRAPHIYTNLEIAVRSRRLARRLMFKWLRPDEVVYFLARKHRIVLYQSMLAPGASLVVPLGLFYVWFSVVPNLLIGLLALLSFAAVAGWLIWRVIDWGNDYYIVTNQRVVYREKVVGVYDSRQESPLNTIASVGLEANQIGKILDYGNVIIRTFVGKIVFANVDHPAQAAKMIEEYWNRTKEFAMAVEKEAMKNAIRRQLGIPVPEKKKPDLVPPVQQPPPPRRRKRRFSLLRLLGGHPAMEVSVVAAHSQAGTPVADLFPNLVGDRVFDTVDADHLGELQCGRKPSRHPGEAEECDLTEAREFNLMFETTIGPVHEAGSTVYLRPETAQGIFLDFKTTLQYARRKPPFGIAQVGKSFRNEITPGNFVFRTREFEQMEMEFFVEPGTDEEWHQYWIDARMDWYVDLGIRRENLRIREHDEDELSHYAKRTVDIEYYFPDASMGWSELEGLANRTDFDLKAHEKHSGQDLTYYDQERDVRYHPYVIEPAAGATRATLAFLFDAYRVEQAPDAKGEMQERIVLKLDKRLAPYKVAVLPLSKKDTLTPTAKEVFDLLKARWMVEYDETQSIGRRYRRQDEIGTPYCVTVAFDTLEARAVTVRDRDSMHQDRVTIDRLEAYLAERLPGY